MTILKVSEYEIDLKITTEEKYNKLQKTKKVDKSIDNLARSKYKTITKKRKKTNHFIHSFEIPFS